MRSILFLFFFLFCSVLNAVEPEAPRKEHVEFHHGKELRDPYHWLQERDHPDVLRYLEAEREYAKKEISIYEEIVQSLKEEMLSYKIDPYSPNSIQQGTYVYSINKLKDKEYPVYTRRKIDSTEEEVVLDLNIYPDLVKDKEIGRFLPSSDHNKIVFSLGNSERDDYTAYIKDLSGGELQVLVENITANIEWAEDGIHLFAVNSFEDPPIYKKLYRIHSISKEKQLVYQEQDPRFILWMAKSSTKDYIFVTSDANNTTSEVRIIDAHSPHSAIRVAIPRKQGHWYKLRHAGEYFIISSNLLSPKNQLYKTKDVYNLNSEEWQALPYSFAQGEKEVRDFLVFEKAIVVKYFQDTFHKMSWIDRSLNQIHEMESFDKIHDSGITKHPMYPRDFILWNNEYQAESALISISSFVHPNRVYEINFDSKELTLKGQDQVSRAVSSEDFKVSRIFIDARDGESIPVTILHRKDLDRSKPQPLLQWGYGSYGYFYPIAFDREMITLLDRGFIFAIAHVRGSSAKGSLWHKAGTRMQKKNSFFDFIDVANYFIESGYTNKNQIFAQGSSGGGLLMGATLNYEPNLFKAVVLHVPNVDILNRLFTGPSFFREEYGDPLNIFEHFEYVRSYCPYQNLRETEYTNILVTSGYYDFRVSYSEAAKYVAKLRSVRTNKSKLIFDIDMQNGHFESRTERYSKAYAFMMSLLNLP